MISYIYIYALEIIQRRAFSVIYLFWNFVWFNFHNFRLITESKIRLKGGVNEINFISLEEQYAQLLQVDNSIKAIDVSYARHVPYIYCKETYLPAEIREP